MSETRTTLVPPEILADQYPVIAEMRERDPVFYDETIQGWLVFRHDDVKTLLSDPRYSRDRKLSPHYDARRQPSDPVALTAHDKRPKRLGATPRPEVIVPTTPRGYLDG